MTEEEEKKESLPDLEENLSSLRDGGPVQETRLTLESRMTFECHPGVSCFTACCNNIDIMLTPYDVLRMKQRLDLSSTDFVEKYTRSAIEEKTGLPQLFLRMEENEKRSCPFVTPEGCSIYTDRPSMCRYYPVGQAVHRIEKDGEIVNDEFFMLIREPHCKGFEEGERTWTIAEWRENQDAAHYDEMHRRWKDLFMRQGEHSRDMDETRQALFFLASYDLDRFRRYVFESDFLKVILIDQQTQDRIRDDELELMKFAIRYLNYAFGIEESFSIDSEVAKERVARAREKEEAADIAAEQAAGAPADGAGSVPSQGDPADLAGPDS
ncbi:MAG: YkgJ family cysteine cluster protein [Gaiellales bacterium]|nr:MAG: YkgJ family cysteine cluster protein [Gaiellales bacterium]